MLLKGDRIKLVKPIPGLDRVGDVFEVLDILEGGTISFKSDYGAGVMSFSEFRKYFEKKNILTWSPWESIRFDDDDTIYSYRTNNKRIELRLGDIKSSASCHENDEFDLSKGLSLCLARLLVKQLVFVM